MIALDNDIKQSTGTVLVAGGAALIQLNIIFAKLKVVGFIGSVNFFITPKLPTASLSNALLSEPTSSTVVSL